MGSTDKLHELKFHIQVQATTNVNGIEPQLVMAWCLHHANLMGKRDPVNRKRFLDAAREIANIYPYMELAKLVQTVEE